MEWDGPLAERPPKLIACVEIATLMAKAVETLTFEGNRAARKSTI